MMACTEGLRVLVVDDDPVVRERLAFHLDDWGHEASLAGSARSAVRRIGELRPDVVITDVVFPDSSGFDLLRELKARDAALPIILISAHVEPDQAARAMRAGADDLLPKPLDVDQLRSLVDGAHDRLHALARAHAGLLEADDDGGRGAEGERAPGG